MESNLEPPTSFYEESNSNCSSPYVSAPSSPGPTFGFFHSAPTSPVHYVLSSPPPLAPTVSDASSTASFEFDFAGRFDSPAPELGSSTMSSADELFSNGQIKPMKLSPAHLQPVAPVLGLGRQNGHDGVEEETFRRARFRDRSQRRRARSLSPLRSSADWLEGGDDKAEETSAGDRGAEEKRSSGRWDFLKDFLRSKSEGSGRSNNKFWHNISSSRNKDRDRERVCTTEKMGGRKAGEKEYTPAMKKKAGPGKRRSVHEMHYYAEKRAQAEERRKKTFLPYRHGVLGCLGFNSKSYGAVSGFATALNPLSSR